MVKRVLTDSKGMSPLIAAVLLIAFTVAIAAILTTWASRYTKGQTKSVEDQTEKRVQCTWGELKVICAIFDIADQNKPPVLKLQVTNSGTIPLWDLRITLKNKEGDIKICNVDIEKSRLTNYEEVTDMEGRTYCTPSTLNSTECYGIKETDIKTLYADLASCGLDTHETLKEFMPGGSIAEQLNSLASVSILTMCPNVKASTQQCSSVCVVDRAAKCPEE